LITHGSAGQQCLGTGTSDLVPRFSQFRGFDLFLPVFLFRGIDLFLFLKKCPRHSRKYFPDDVVQNAVVFFGMRRGAVIFLSGYRYRRHGGYASFIVPSPSPQGSRAVYNAGDLFLDSQRVERDEECINGAA